jgi:hypothetical protein
MPPVIIADASGDVTASTSATHGSYRVEFLVFFGLLCTAGLVFGIMVGLPHLKRFSYSRLPGSVELHQSNNESLTHGSNNRSIPSYGLSALAPPEERSQDDV